MYVWARLAKMAATAKSRGPFNVGDTSCIAFRCLPSDVDSNLHMNNARYPMLADVGRYDIFFRSGLVKLGRERGWAPMMGGIQCVFLREIRLWRRFELFSSLELWRGLQFMGKHRFVLENGQTACEILTTAGIYDLRNRRFVAIDEVMVALGINAASREPTEAESRFLASHEALRAQAKLPISQRLDNASPAD
ncbi:MULTISPECIES: thioesterase family protein [Mesorhizobium]|uniref:Thioesterase n=1 Tax=Mesorhizobium denitrificans TaxID=2294114 RepID=A0A371XD29_9HYPH|nr:MULTISPECIES: thioesterase family protein [Mesorhizobium]RFC67130.1 thioesterase [Mesorhizobium denitrificans]